MFKQRNDTTDLSLERGAITRLVSKVQRQARVNGVHRSVLQGQIDVFTQPHPCLKVLSVGLFRVTVSRTKIP
jgi:hypothetical protein